MAIAQTLAHDVELRRPLRLLGVFILGAGCKLRGPILRRAGSEAARADEQGGGKREFEVSHTVKPVESVRLRKRARDSRGAQYVLG